MSGPVVMGCGIPVFGVKTCQNQKTVYYNAEQSLSCPAGFVPHTYVAAAGKFHSLLSQADVDSQATVYLTDLIVGRCVPLIPVVTGATITVGPGGLVNYQILATNSPVSYTAAPLPVGLILDPVTGIISGTVPVALISYSVSLSATNGAGTGYGTLTINVLAYRVVQFSDAGQGGVTSSRQVSVDGGAYAPVNYGVDYNFVSQIKMRTTISGTQTFGAPEYRWLMNPGANPIWNAPLASGSSAAVSFTLLDALIRVINGGNDGSNVYTHPGIDHTDTTGPNSFAQTLDISGTTIANPNGYFAHDVSSGGSRLSVLSIETILNF